MVPPSRLMALVGQALKWCASHACSTNRIDGMTSYPCTSMHGRAICEIITILPTACPRITRRALGHTRHGMLCTSRMLRTWQPWSSSRCIAIEGACCMSRQQAQGLLPPGTALDLFRGTAQGQRDAVERFPAQLDRIIRFGKGAHPEAAVFSPDGNMLATATVDGFIEARLWRSWRSIWLSCIRQCWNEAHLDTLS